METLPRVVWRAEKNEFPGGTSADHWWIMSVDEEAGNSLLIRCNSQEATMKRDNSLGPLVVTRAYGFTWVKSSEIWRPADQMPPTVGARVEICEHTGAVRVGTVLEPRPLTTPGTDLTTMGWMVDTGTHPIVWWRPVEWQATREDIRLFLSQPIHMRWRLLRDHGGAEDIEEMIQPRTSPTEWGTYLKSVVDDGDLPGFLTALRALAK